jgi:thioredoxin
MNRPYLLLFAFFIPATSLINSIPPSGDLPSIADVPNQRYVVASGLPLNLADIMDGTKSADTVLNNLITGSNTPFVVVDFFAEWCGPCKALSPILISLAGEFKNVVFIKVNVDSYKSISNKYGIKAMPTILCFRNGQQVARLTPSSKEPFSKSHLKKRLKEIFG